jgi:acyl-coenzyme A thioesterase PaaI-like protein
MAGRRRPAIRSPYLSFTQPKNKTKTNSQVCGYPRITHGGLTAAIVDEAMGFLFYSLRSHAALPFRGPAFTARLEVNYQRKIPAGRLLCVTAEVERMEGRKLCMKATVADRPPGHADARVYATATALFVSPRPTRLVREVVRYAAALVVPGMNFD